MKEEQLNPARNYDEKESFVDYQKRRKAMNALLKYRFKNGVFFYKHAPAYPVKTPTGTQMVQPKGIPYRREMKTSEMGFKEI